MFQISEDDLEVLEREIPNIFDLATFTDAYNQRPDIKEGAEMVKKVLSHIRWNYGPPLEIRKLDNEP